MSRRLTIDQFAAAVRESRRIPSVSADRLDALIAACDGLSDDAIARVAAIEDPAARLRYLGSVATAAGEGLDALRLA